MESGLEKYNQKSTIRRTLMCSQFTIENNLLAGCNNIKTKILPAVERRQSINQFAKYFPNKLTPRFSWIINQLLFRG